MRLLQAAQVRHVLVKDLAKAAQAHFQLPEPSLQCVLVQASMHTAA